MYESYSNHVHVYAYLHTVLCMYIHYMYYLREVQFSVRIYIIYYIPMVCMYIYVCTCNVQDTVVRHIHVHIHTYLSGFVPWYLEGTYLVEGTLLVATDL